MISRDYICDYFVHNPNNAEKGDAHIHVCTNKSNITKRCGYNSAKDSKDNCILYENKRKRTHL